MKCNKFDPIFLFSFAFDENLMKKDKCYSWWNALHSVLGLLKTVLMEAFKSGNILYLFMGKSAYRDIFIGKFLFYSPSLNNQRSVESIKKEISKTNPTYEIKSHYGIDSFPIGQMILYSFLKLPSLIYEIHKLDNYRRNVCMYNFTSLFLASSYVWYFKEMVGKFRPKIVIMSNDHLADTRALEYVCELYSIPCVYIQHASVANYYPELHYSLSILDGKDSLHKYLYGEKKQIGDILILGTTRYDHLSKNRIEFSKKIEKNCIGLGINPIDDNRVANELCNKILSRYPDYRIKVRAHPRLSTPFVFDDERIIYTSALDEPMKVFLDDIDFMIANDSCIHFDALVYGKMTFMYTMSDNGFSDQYNYVNQGLVKYIANFDDLCDVIEHFNNIDPPSIDIIRYFDASYKKRYTGKLSEIVCEIINNNGNLDILSGKYNLKETKEKYYKYYEIID